nr:hypothetical protein GCM10020092_075180 [Actinoplanes digitatis]
MSRVRLLVGTRKGAFVLTADGTRRDWTVSGPHFGGWEIYHVNGSPADPDRLWASQSSSWFGQIIQRSDDGGASWQPVGNDFAYQGPIGDHLWYDGTPRPWEFKRIWHLEPSRTDPDVVYAGAEDAALYRSDDGGQKWQELTGLRTHESGPRWQPGAGGMCLHTIILDPVNPDRIFVAISAAERLPHRRRRRHLAADQPGPALRPDPRRGRRGRPLRAPAGHAPVPAGRAVHAEALGRAAHRRRRADRGGRSAATCRRTSDSRSPCTRTSPTPSTSCRSRATRSTTCRTASCGSTAAAPAATSGSR